MASPLQVRSILCFVVQLLLLSSSSLCLSSRTIHTDSSDKVSLGLYYESLCPYSANFIVNYLSKLFEDDDLLSVVDLHLSPWGNAKIKANDTYVCQHGAAECLLNTVEACAIHTWPQLKEHFAFIYCIEDLVYDRKYYEWKSCFEKLDLDPKPIFDCYTNGYGKELELQYAAETNALQPPHQYVPWVVVNGQPLYEDYENFLSYICKAYKGTSELKACSNLSDRISQSRKTRPTHPVCYKETIMSKLQEQIRSAISLWMHPQKRAFST